MREQINTVWCPYCNAPYIPRKEQGTVMVQCRCGKWYYVKIGKPFIVYKAEAFR